MTPRTSKQLKSERERGEGEGEEGEHSSALAIQFSLLRTWQRLHYASSCRELREDCHPVV